MSDAMTMVWRGDYPSPTAKFVALALAKHADPHGYCYPSQRKLAELTGFSKRTVTTALAALEDGGFIRRAESFRPDGSRGVDDIFLTLAPVVVSLDEPLSGGGERASRGVAKGSRGGGERGASQNSPPEEDHLKKMATVVALSPKVDASDARQAFDMFNVLIRTLNDDVPLSLKRSVAMELTASRRQHLNARLRECGGLDGWVEALDRVARSPFLSGRIRGRHGQFAISLDFILQPSSFTKLREGIYDGERQSTHAPGGGGSPGGGERNAAMFAGARAAVERHERERGRGGGA